jgi:hypothetical protein
MNNPFHGSFERFGDLPGILESGVQRQRPGKGRLTPSLSRVSAPL